MTHKHSSPIVVHAFAAPFARYPGYVISATRSRDQHVIVIVLTRPASTDSRLVRKLAHAQHHAAPPKRRQNNVKNVTGRKIGVDRPCFDSSFSFDGSFHANCQQDAVPPSLLALINMILDGANIKHQTQLVNTPTTKPALAISQLMVFNSVKQARNVESSHPVRHSRSQETPLPLFLSFKIHAVTRSRCLVDTLFNLGLCVSYDRLLLLTSDIANGVCQRFRVEDVVCPPKLRHGLFTTGAVDNIDHNPSSATAKDSFDGTGISLMQHPSHTHGGIDRGVPVISEDGSYTKLVTPLPSAYTSVPPTSLRAKEFTVPAVQGPVRPSNLQVTVVATEDEYAWLGKVKTAVEKSVTNGWISWSA